MLLWLRVLFPLLLLLQVFAKNETEKLDEWVDGDFLSGGSLQDDVFFTYGEVVERLKRLAERFPDDVDYENIGKSGDEREIPCVIVAHKPRTKDEHIGIDMRPSVLFTGMTQPREVLAMMQVMYLLRTLVVSKDDSTLQLLRSTRFVLVPIINPDGYEHLRLQDPAVREKVPKNTAKTCREDSSKNGVNLGHNWGFMFDSKTTEDGFDKPCNDLYRGSEPFSEPETRAVRDLILKHQFKAAIFFHSRSEREASRLIVPYMYHKSYLKTHRDDKKNRLIHQNDLKVYDRITSTMQDALPPKAAKYEYGTAYELMNKTISGSEIDWTFDQAGIFSLILQVGTKDGSYLPKKEHIMPLLEVHIQPILSLAKISLELPRKTTPRTSIAYHLSVFPLFLGLALALVLLFGFFIARYLGYDNIVHRFKTFVARLQRMSLRSSYTNLNSRVKDEDLEVDFDDLELEGDVVDGDDDEVGFSYSR
ncbi:hypothetical protein HDU97_005645 [Phlyctochytrium planicorne]|nr:hypothetical protein HDU97_005645 [Phlyctochytrium planicorne]